MSGKIQVGVDTPEMAAVCNEIQRLIYDCNLSNAEIIAALDLVKLEYQLELMEVLGGEG